jgi:hypothetical protein
VLGRYVREEKVLTWQGAIRKMTALPAATIGMVDRGYIAAGMAADITVFDPEKIVDHATYENPAALSEGIQYVFVNGALAVREGKVTGVQGGRVLTRSGGMPSRPMTANQDRRVTAKGNGGPFDLTLDVSQRPGARQARGTFKLTLARGRGKLTADEIGVLQVTADWASFTAQAKIEPAGIVRPVTVIVDRGDPLAGASEAVIIVELEGARACRGTLPEEAVKLLPGSRVRR